MAYAVSRKASQSLKIVVIIWLNLLGEFEDSNVQIVLHR